MMDNTLSDDTKTTKYHNMTTNTDSQTSSDSPESVRMVNFEVTQTPQLCWQEDADGKMQLMQICQSVHDPKQFHWLPVPIVKDGGALRSFRADEGAD